MKRSTYAALAVATALSIGHASAQTSPTSDAPADEAASPDQSATVKGDQRRQRALDAIRKTRGERVTESLQLTSRQGVVLETLNRFDDELFALAREGRKLRQQGRQAADSHDQGQLKRVTEAVLKLRGQRVAFEERRFRAVAKHLTAEQAAVAVHLLPRLDRQIGRAVGRVLKRRQGAKDKSIRGQ